MRVAVEELEGVAEASVSLEEGELHIVFAPANRLTMEGVRDVIRDQGFTPREADVRVRGVSESGDGARMFRVLGSGVRHQVVASSDVARELEERAGVPVVALAQLEGDAGAPLRIVSIEGGS